MQRLIAIAIIASLVVAGIGYAVEADQQQPSGLDADVKAGTPLRVQSSASAGYPIDVANAVFDTAAEVAAGRMQAPPRACDGTP